MVHKDFEFKYDKTTKYGSLKIGDKVTKIDLHNAKEPETDFSVQETDNIPVSPVLSPTPADTSKFKARAKLPSSFGIRGFSSNFSSFGSGSGSGTLGYGIYLI